MANTHGSKSYLELSWAMLKTGILGYGGGPSVIPLLRHEAVTRYKWVDDEEFAEVLAIANTLPGPIATKMAAYLGYHRKGSGGACAAVLAHIFPSAAAMIALMSVVQWLSHSAIVQGMISAVVPVIAVMIGVMAYEFGERTLKGLGKLLGICLFAIAFLLLQILGVHAAIVIVLFLAYGSIHFKLIKRIKNKLQSEKNKQRTMEHGGGEVKPWNG